MNTILEIISLLIIVAAGITLGYIFGLTKGKQLAKQDGFDESALKKAK